MRIATSTIYDNQVASIDNLVASYQQEGNTLSTGKQLNAPSDNPTGIAQDLAVRNDNAVTSQIGKNMSNLSAELTTVDGAMSTLTNVLQSARSLVVEAASDAISPSQQGQIATQIDQLLQEAIGISNTQYAGKYVFAGTSGPPQPFVRSTGSPIASVTALGNNVHQVQQLPNGQTVQTGVTLQQAFNYQSPDGSPDVFQTLITLRDTMQKQQIVDESSTHINVGGTSISAAAGGTTIAQMSQGAVPKIMVTPLAPDSTGNVSINISSGTAPNGVTITFNPADDVPTILAKINAQTASTGVSASFNAQTQRLSLTSANSQPFLVKDWPSAGATNTGNFLAAFNLTGQADLVNNLTRQLGDLDHVIGTAISARTTLGATIQTVQSLNSSADSQVLNDTQVQSGLEDADIAKVVSQFSQTQTALQAAYGTTTRLESKTLFDYLQ